MGVIQKQFIKDDDGNQVGIVLSIAEYQALIKPHEKIFKRGIFLSDCLQFKKLNKKKIKRMKEVDLLFVMMSYARRPIDWIIRTWSG